LQAPEEIDKYRLTVKAHHGMESQRNKPHSRPRPRALRDEGKFLDERIYQLMLTAVKILKGSLKESLYEMPREGPGTPPRLVKESYYAENQVTHISDKIGIHKISNPSVTEFAVSLHLYTPPYAAKFGFHVFDETTGEPKHIMKATLTSDRGVELKM
jgi:hypothetical protein